MGIDDIAEEIGEIKEEQDEDGSREGEEFNIDDFKRDKEEYDGGW